MIGLLVLASWLGISILATEEVSLCKLLRGFSHYRHVRRGLFL